jgi:hypothetical protein
MGTLAFDYRIPVITAPSGLEDVFLAPFSITTCPAHYTGNSDGVNEYHFISKKAANSGGVSIESYISL